MRLGVIADVHGNDEALRAVLDDAARYQLGRWWVLGDLVLFGPRPAEVLDRLRTLPGVAMLSGNTDRYVLTGEQPAPHATAADAVGRLDLVERFAKMAAGIGWTRGVPDQAGMPRPPGQANWLLLQDGGRGDVIAEHRTVPFDVGAVVRDLHRRRHPNAAFVAGILTGQREQLRTPAP